MVSELSSILDHRYRLGVRFPGRRERVRSIRRGDTKGYEGMQADIPTQRVTSADARGILNSIEGVLLAVLLAVLPDPQFL